MQRKYYIIILCDVWYINGHLTSVLHQVRQ